MQATVASDKHEMLFSEFKMNYNKEADMFKKGSIVYRDVCLDDTASFKKLLMPYSMITPVL